MPAARVLVPVVLVSVCLAWLFVLGMAHGHRGADLIVVLDGGAARLARAEAFRQQLHPQPHEQLLIRCPRTQPPPQPMPELLQGYDTATQITALRLSLWRVTGSTDAGLMPHVVARKCVDCGL